MTEASVLFPVNHSGRETTELTTAHPSHQSVLVGSNILFLAPRHPLPLLAHQKILALQAVALALVVEGLARQAEGFVGGLQTPALAAQLRREDRLLDGVEALRQRALARPAAPATSEERLVGKGWVGPFGVRVSPCR